VNKATARIRSGDCCVNLECQLQKGCCVRCMCALDVPSTGVLITEGKLILSLYLKNISPPNALINSFIQGFAHCTVQKQNLSLHISLSPVVFSYSVVSHITSYSIFLWVFPTFVFLVVPCVGLSVTIYFPSFSLHIQTFCRRSDPFTGTYMIMDCFCCPNHL
jgi:hypothetical protein